MYCTTIYVSRCRLSFFLFRLLYLYTSMDKFIYSGGQIWPPGQRKKPPAAGGGRARAVVDSFLLQQKTRGCRLVGSLVCGWSVLVSIVVLVARERQRTAPPSLANPLGKQQQQVLNKATSTTLLEAIQ